MSSPLPSRLVGIRAKTERAEQHIVDLNRAIRSFLDSKPYEVGTKRDPKTGDLIYHVVKAVDAPLQLALIAGDAIQNLRTALDHLACQLVMANGNQITIQTSFPIYKSAQNYQADSPRKVKGISQAAINLIDATKPYPGGNDFLWEIHRLNNIDKHNLLLVAGTAHVGTGIGLPTELRWELQEFSHGILLDSAVVLGVPNTRRLCPLKTSDVLHVLPAQTEQNVNVYFDFDVAFGEAGVVQGKPMLETLQKFAHLVDGIVTQFIPFL